jgi:BirA family biotin operon repressor/biotin-[acetyl-CoA-carboxylase] ligase
MPDAFDLARFESVLTTRWLARNLIFEPSTTSTMDLARDAAHHGAAQGTLVVTDEQTAGRGRLGRSWLAPPATNLLSTMVLRPPHHALRQLAMIAPLAIVQAVESVVGLQASIKWPNDVQMSARKVAGILIETEGGGRDTVALVGAGVNVNFDPSAVPELREIATSLMLELGREVEREALLASYAVEFERLYEAACAGGSLRNRWRERLTTLGERVTASWPGGSAEGVAEDVDDDGSLLVRTDSGQRVAVEAGDVTLRT